MIYIKKIVLLFGGISPEHDVSIASFKSIYTHLDQKKFSVDSIYITKENTWIKCFYDETTDTITNIEEITNIIEILKNYDCVFPILHGKNGEDGKLQGMMEAFNIPYVGCDSLSSQIGLDKSLSKILFSYLEIPQLPFIITNSNVDFKKLKQLEYPVIVKPSNGGSSIGISIANNKKELKEAIKIASNLDNKIIIEKFIKARELEVAVLKTNKMHISNVGEIKYSATFYDFKTKYQSNEYELIIPSNIPKNIKKQIQEYALKIFENMHCKDLARIDFLYNEEENQIYINEINTMPGFTNISMYPKLLMHDKISYEDLLAKLIENNIHL